MRVRSIGKKYKKEYRQGFATLEILIAFTIVILCISAVIMVAFGNQSVTVDLETNSEAIWKAQALLEASRADSRFDFNLVNPFTDTQISGPLTFTKTLDVTQTDLFTKKVTATVSWQTSGRNLSTVFSTLLTNPRSDGTCSSVLVGDWTNPQLTSDEFGKDLLVPSDPSSGFPIGDIDVHNQTLYVVVNNSNGNNGPTFFKFDVTNPGVRPVFISSMDNNPTVKSGFNAVNIAGNYAYVANANGANFNTCSISLSCSQLQIIDIKGMSVAGKLKIPGASGSGGQAVGRAVFYQDGIVYLGLAKTSGSGPEFNIIDVGGGGNGGSPINPVYISGLHIGNGVNAIYVKDGYVYVASPDNEELKVIDVRIPSSPSQVGQFDAPGGGGNNGNGKSLALVGNALYFGRTLLTGNEFYILDKTNPATNLPALGFRDVKNSSNNNTSVNGITVRDYLIFLLTNNDFQVLKQDSSFNLNQYAAPLPTPGGSGTTMDCEGNYIYFASVPGNNKGYIVRITAGP